MPVPVVRYIIDSLGGTDPLAEKEMLNAMADLAKYSRGFDELGTLQWHCHVSRPVP